MPNKNVPKIDLADAVEKRKRSEYLLRLYVSGATKKSTAAIRRITAICDEHLKDRYNLEIVDVRKKPSLAKGDQILALPTLVKELPGPLRKLIGDMADKEKVLLGLDIRRWQDKPAKAKPERQEG